MTKRIIFFGFLLLWMAVESQAQNLQFFRKDGGSVKYDATGVDSLYLNKSEGTITLYFSDGSRENIPAEETDSVVIYDETRSILSTLRQKGNYSTFLRLVQEDAYWTDQMNGATDLTVFAADDDSWQRFFAENANRLSPDPWHTATSYEALTAEQKNALLAAAIVAPQKIADTAGIGGSDDKLRVQSATKLAEVWTPILTPAYCDKYGITETDRTIISGTSSSAPWMAGNSFVEADIACGNGWLEQMAAPLKPLGTMADVIHENGNTDIFAYIMDLVVKDPDLSYPIKFDPAWAGYHDELLPEQDMAAMFVPSDKTMWSYFTEGAGQALLTAKPTSKEELIQQIDGISPSVLSALIRNGFMRSFAYTVPSKWSLLRDEAMQPLFDDVNKAKAKLDTCLLANNGMVYVMDQSFMSADYKSVTAPAYISSSCMIMKSAIYSGAIGVPDFMNLNYDAYLKVPQQDITFFLPPDSALAYYYDPISMKGRTPRVIVFQFTSGSFPVKVKVYNYFSPYRTGGEIGTIGGPLPGSLGTCSNEEVINRLKDILYSHTIVNDGTQDIHSRNEYYRTFGGDVVKVVRDASGKIVGAKGTFQLENERQGINTGTRGVTECVVTNSYESLTNGQTYALDAPLVPTYRSLWSIMTNDADRHFANEDGFGGETPYSEFYKLCAADSYQNLIVGCGLVDGNLTSSQMKTALKKYVTFINDKGLDFNLSYLLGNTPFTAYIPTNEAVQRAIAQGLPTWEEISEDFNSHSSDGMLTSFEDSLRIAEKIMILTDVVKAHFHYGLAIADQEPFRKEYKSLWIDRETMVSPKVTVNCTGNGNMSVTDWKGHTFDITDNKNVFVRDYTCSSSPIGSSMRGITINAYRPGVVHQINGVLGF